jgi:hypothetical protein
MRRSSRYIHQAVAAFIKKHGFSYHVVATYGRFMRLIGMVASFSALWTNSDQIGFVAKAYHQGICTRTRTSSHVIVLMNAYSLNRVGLDSLRIEGDEAVRRVASTR